MTSPARALRRRSSAFRRITGARTTEESHRHSRRPPAIGEPVCRTALRPALARKEQIGLSCVSIFALALGIGATTVMFSVVYNVFFDPLPYKNFNRSWSCNPNLATLALEGP